MSRSSENLHVVYHPDQNRGWGPRVWISMAEGLLASRELIWRLFVRDFSARYKQSLLGIGWAVVLPLVALGTFILLNHAGIFDTGDIEIPYPAWALLNLTVWQVFAAGLTATTGSIVAGGSMVVKINFPKAALVISSLGNVMVETVIRIAMVTVLFVWYDITPSLTALLAPFVLVPVLALTLALGFVLSLLNALLRDVIHVVTVGITFLLLVTPVLYADPGSGILSTIARYNPMTTFVQAARDLVLHGGLSQPESFFWACLGSMTTLLLTWRLFTMVEPRMVERV